MSAIDKLFKLEALDIIVNDLIDSLPRELATRCLRAKGIVEGEDGYTLTSQDNGRYWDIHKEDGSTHVHYIIDEKRKFCQCKDWRDVRMGLCKHRLAVKIKKTLMEQEK